MTQPQKITFNCIAGSGTKLEETWLGSISYLNHFGSHYEMLIHSRSLIYVLFGKSKHGYFACFPDWQAGCHLVDFKDLFWNTESLSQVIGDIDGITVAKALYSISDLIENS